jgi:ABC-type multidrug transport system permease subunit
MKAVQIAQKNLKEFWRNIKKNIIIFILPIAFIGIFGITLSNTDESLSIGYIESDNAQFEAFISGLESAENEDGRAVFDLESFTEFEDGKDKLESGSIGSLIEWSEEDSVLTVYSNPLSNGSVAISGAVESIAVDFFNPDSVRYVQSKSIIGDQENFSPFEILAPGLIIYGVLVLIPQVAQRMSQISERKEKFRYFTSKVKSSDIILGYLMSQTVIAIIQSVILIASAVAFGFNPEGNMLSVVLIVVLTNLFSVGLGILIGSLSKNSETASNTGTIVSIILGFMSGSFIVGLDSILILGELFGQEISVPDLFPSTYAVESIKDILLFEKSLLDTLPSLMIVLGSSIVILLIGVVAFQKRQMRNIM